MTLGTVAQTSKPAAEEAEAEALTLRHSGGKAAWGLPKTHSNALLWKSNQNRLHLKPRFPRSTLASTQAQA